MIKLLDKVLAAAKLGKATVERSDTYWAREDRRTLTLGEASVQLELPDEGDAGAMAVGLTLAFESYAGEQGHMTDWIDLLATAAVVQSKFNEAIADQVAKAKQEQAEEQQREEQQRQRETQQLEERSEQLLTEFLEEPGRIRLRGLKRWRPVTVGARELGDGTYQPYFRYVQYKHGYTEQMSKRVVAFEIKVGSRYQNVWDDGQEDLREWDRNDRRSPSYDGNRKE